MLHRWQALLFACLAVPTLVRAGSPETLTARYRELREGTGATAFGLPLLVRSEERDTLLSAEAYGILDHPFPALVEALTTPANWCEFVPLNPNVKACVHRTEAVERRLTFFVGRKFYQPPERAREVTYRYGVEEVDDSYLRVTLTAQEGPFGTKDHAIEIEAMAVEDCSFVCFRSSYRPSTASRLATAVYLGTFGRNKVGFTVEGRDGQGNPVYVKGVKGIVERNAVRYYLALQAFMEAQGLPLEQRFDARLRSWFTSAERYRRQLHEMERSEYLKAKRREREHQLELQRERGAAGEVAPSRPSNVGADLTSIR